MTNSNFHLLSSSWRLWSLLSVFAMLLLPQTTSQTNDFVLPTCDSVDVTSRFNCTVACTNMEQTRLEFRDVNGKSRCSCNETKVCSDTPTCEELLVTPGSAQEGCQNICGENGFVEVEDFVRYAGTATNSNLDKTHVVVSCRCNGQELCNDAISFSDRVDLQSCKQNNLASEEECEAYCLSFGTLFTGMTYSSPDGLARCVCNSAEGEATACQDSGGSIHGILNSATLILFAAAFFVLF